MKILKLRLYAKQLSPLYDFYHKILGFEKVRLDKTELFIQAGKTELIFEKHSQGFIYHFAFLIPQGNIPEAISYLTKRKIDLLPYKEKSIIDFGTGKAIYFRDPAANIVEFIDRPGLKISSKGKFSINQIQRINEIGMPVEEPLEVSQLLRGSYQIDLVKPEILTDNFCWIGDYEGVFIVVKKGRHWLPTQIASILNDFEVEFQEANRMHSFTFKKGKIYD